MNRQLEQERVEGEIGLVIDYTPGQSRALDVLSGVMALVSSLDALDRALLSSISTGLEPVSILNDVQHSSIKLILARVLKKIPDDSLASLEWKKWVGGLLVKGKHLLLQNLAADAPVIDEQLKALDPIYKSAPGLIGYDPPQVKDIQEALQGVARARATIEGETVIFQTELGDVVIGKAQPPAEALGAGEVVQVLTNRGRELLKVRYPDMLGQAQWTVMRGGHSARVEVLHRSWLADYQGRKLMISPGDSLDCSFEESIGYDAYQNEVERKLRIIEVHGVITPPTQTPLALGSPDY